MNCPLCQSENNKIIEIIPFEELKEIWKHSNIREINNYLSEKTFLLRECQDCDLQFFSPEIVGENNFYSAFRKTDYYSIYWDHKEIIKYILNYNLKSILDYGCGEGLFLNLLPVNISRIGIDFNVQNKEIESLKLIKTDLLNFQTKKNLKE